MYNGDSVKSLIAYNWGPGNVNLYLRGERRVPTVSKQYVEKIKSYHSKWSTEFSSNRAQYEYGALYHAIY
jgi:trehalose utilization protein